MWVGGKSAMVGLDPGESAVAPLRAETGKGACDDRAIVVGVVT